MSEIQDKMYRKITCEQMYVELDISVEECAKVIGVSVKTVYRWMNEGNWTDKKLQSKNLDNQIYINLRRALNQGLKGFALDPTNKDLQSLVSLLKQFKEQSRTTRADKDNILNFIDKTTDFFLEKGMEEIANVFKSCLVELAEYLLLRK